MIAKHIIETLGIHAVICAAFFGIFGIVGFAYSLNPILGTTYFLLAVGSLFILAYSRTIFVGSVIGMILVALAWRMSQMF